MKKVKTRRVPRNNHGVRYGARTHIEYLHDCEHCKNEYWARKRDGRFCTNACRSLYRLGKLDKKKK